MEETVDVWRMSTDLITIIPNFSGFHEEEFTLSPKASLHSVLPFTGKGSDFATGFIWKKELSLLEQSLPFFNSLGVYLTAERIYSTLLLCAANFVEDDTYQHP